MKKAFLIEVAVRHTGQDKVYKITRLASGLVRERIVLQPDEFHKPGHRLQGDGVRASKELEMHQQLAMRPWQSVLRSTYTARGQQLKAP